jgi:hypothetical protein
LLALLALSSPLVRADVNQTETERLLQEALERYEIGGSRIVYQGLKVVLIFPVNDLNEDGSIEITTFSDNQCSVNIDGNDFLMPNITYDDNLDPDGLKNREITIVYTIDPILIQLSDVWIQTENDQFFMKFCVAFGLKLDSAPATAVISTLETVISLQVDLVGDFGESVNVGPNDQNEEEAEQIYYVEGFLCDEKTNQPLMSASPRSQGSMVRVCVKPRDDALVDGVYMRRVDSFTFTRDDLLGGGISQEAVRDGRTANDALTQLECPRGVDLCYFDTLLRSDFYFGPGTVNGFGEAWLQVSSKRKLCYFHDDVLADKSATCFLTLVW